MKKLFYFILCLLFCLCIFSACNDQPIATNPTNPSEPSITNGQYTPGQPSDVPAKLSGKWKFTGNDENNGLNISGVQEDLVENVNFVSNSHMFTAMKISASGNGYVLHFNDTIACSYEASTSGNSNLWADEKYLLVDFGSMPQDVSREFYNWFTSNAQRTQ